MMTLSEKTQSVMVNANNEAQRSGSENIQLIHVLIAVLSVEVLSGKHRASVVLWNLGHAIDTILRDARLCVTPDGSAVHSSRLEKAPETKQVLIIASGVSAECNYKVIHTDHILYGLAVYAENNPEDDVGVIFARHCISSKAVKDELSVERE